MIGVGANGDVFCSGKKIISNAFPTIPSGSPFYPRRNWIFYGTEVYSSPEGTGCCKCGCGLSYDNLVSVYSCSGVNYSCFCLPCAGISQGGMKFEFREDWIRDGLPPDMSGTHPLIASDWLEEHGRLKDAEYMRSLAKRTNRSD